MATALYRRYRPETFADVIGQDHVTVPLMRALRSGRVGHAYLFSGPRGCGKTTSARILARCLNCEQGPTDTPCGQCDSCRDLARGGPGSLDVVEIDAASHGGVDDARELRERATFAPARDRYKVFIIDEAHMVTSAGFNALLKLVEEPPEHVKFVFATTEPDKVIGTIRSRTHHYPFRLIPPQVLTPYLEQLCEAEDVRVGEGVLPLVVRAGGGSARDTLSVLDQLMAGAGEEGLDHRTALALLGFTDTELLERAIDAVSRRDAAAMFAVTEHVITSGQEPRRFVEDLLERLRDLIVLSAVPERGEDLLPQVPPEELARLRDAIEGFDAADLSRCGDLVHETLSSMSGATSPRLHLELLAARLILRDERSATVAPGRADAAGAPGGAMGGQGPRGASAGGGAESGRERARRMAQQQAEQARRSRPQQDGGASAPAASDAGQSGAAPSAPAPASPAQNQQQPCPQHSDREQAPPARPDPAQDPAAQPAPESHAAAATPRTNGRGAGAPTTTDADDDWGPVAPIGRGAPEAAPVPERAPQAEDEDRAAPLHGGVVPRHGDAEAAPTASSDEAPSDHVLSGVASSSGTTEPSGPGESPAGGGPSADELRGHWSAIMDELQQIRRASWALIAQNGHVQDMRGSTLVVGFGSEGLLGAFRRGPAAQNLADAVRRVMHLSVEVEAVVGQDPGPGSSGPGDTGGRGPSSGGPGAAGGGSDRNGPSTGGGDGQGPTSDRSGPADRPVDAPDHRGAGQRGGDRGQGPSSGADRPSVRSMAEDRVRQSPGGRGASRGSGPSGRSTPGPVEDFAPEPEDPFPPDPQDMPAPEDHTPAADHVPSDDSDASVGENGASGGSGTHPPEAGDPLVIPDDSRDDLPEDQPRTHGQAALRRALETGRPVRTAPREKNAGPAGSASGATGTSAPERTATGTSNGTATGAPEGMAAGTPDGTATGDEAPGIERPDRTPVGAEAPGNMAAPAPGPQHAAPASGETRGDDPRSAAERSWAEQAGLETGRSTRAVPQESAPADPPDDDPTGGARRDDEDAPRVSAQRPQEIVERLLGGTVLEVIDDNR